MDDNARIPAQFPVELAFANIDGMHARGVTLEQTIREAARRCAEVGTNEAGARDGERVECGFELVAAAACVFLCSLDDEHSVFRDQVAGLMGELPVNADCSRENESLRFLAAFRQTASDELGINTVTHDC
jgi:hypothetical protein